MNPSATLDTLAHTVPLVVTYGATAAGFFVIYVASAFGGDLVAKLLVRGGRFARAGERAPHQRRHELLRSIPAILAFSLWTPILLAFFRSGGVDIDFDVSHISTTAFLVGVEVVALMLWNELHFFSLHALLHTPALYKHVHAVHHRAKVPTPFSTYAMHPVEAFMLGSVLPFAAMFAKLHVITLVVFPVVHLALNTLGHLGVVRACAGAATGDGSIPARHARHHKHARDDFGFATTFFDRLTDHRIAHSGDAGAGADDRHAGTDGTDADTDRARNQRSASVDIIHNARALQTANNA